MNLKLAVVLTVMCFVLAFSFASRGFGERVDAKSFYSSVLAKSEIKEFPKNMSLNDSPTYDRLSAHLRYFGTEKTNNLSNILQESPNSRGRLSEVINLNDSTWKYNSTIGASDAPVLVEVFQDVKCGMCRYAFNNIIPILMEKYVRLNKVKLEFKEFPLIARPFEMSLAVAAKCAGTQNKYKEYLTELYKDGSKLTEESIFSIAIDLGMDIPKFKSCNESRQALAMVRQDRAEANNLGVNGTPTFFINGKILVGAQPIDSFIKIIENVNLKPEI